MAAVAIPVCHQCFKKEADAKTIVKLPGCGCYIHIACIPCPTHPKPPPKTSWMHPYLNPIVLTAAEVAKLDIPDPASARVKFPHDRGTYVRAR